MARRNRRCGGRHQSKVGYLRARHGTSSLTHKFKANVVLLWHRQRMIAIRLRTFAHACCHDQRWQTQQLRRRQDYLFHEPGRWCARGLVTAS